MVDKVDRWTHFVHCPPPRFSKPAGRCPFMNEYKYNKYIRDKGTPRSLGRRGGGQWTKMSTCPLSTANMIAGWIKQFVGGRSASDAGRTSRFTEFTDRIAPREGKASMSQNQFDDLPLIQGPPLPVPIGHPEHPDFKGYEDVPVADSFWTSNGDIHMDVLLSIPGWNPEDE